MDGFTSVPLTHNMFEKLVSSLQRDNLDVHNCSRQHLLRERVSFYSYENNKRLVSY